MAQEEDIKYFVRIGTTDLDGTKSVRVALTGIKGVGRHTSTVISRMAKVDEYATLGRMDEAAVNRLRVAIEQYSGKIPSWMANRPKDVYTGEARHLLGVDVALQKDEDVNLMRKIRCYRGIRHETGQKVRGQRTKSTGRTGTTVGVKRKTAGGSVIHGIPRQEPQVLPDPQAPVGEVPYRVRDPSRHRVRSPEQARSLESTGPPAQVPQGGPQPAGPRVQTLPTRRSTMPRRRSSSATSSVQVFSVPMRTSTMSSRSRSRPSSNAVSSPLCTAGDSHGRRNRPGS